jgi:hypothetical protein
LVLLLYWLYLLDQSVLGQLLQHFLVFQLGQSDLPNLSNQLFQKFQNNQTFLCLSLQTYLNNQRILTYQSSLIYQMLLPTLPYQLSQKYQNNQMFLFLLPQMYLSNQMCRLNQMFHCTQSHQIH